LLFNFPFPIINYQLYLQPIMQKIVILDFGSQYTQLIARCIREANVYCEIQPFHQAIIDTPEIKGVILSGSPCSVNDEAAPNVDIEMLHTKYPILGICYGAQLTAKQLGGVVEKSNKREYGRAILQKQTSEELLFNNVDNATQIWMSHGDTIKALPNGFEIIAITENIPVAAFKKTGESANAFYGLQFHPEVYHSTQGKIIINNFLFNICNCSPTFTSANFIDQCVSSLQQQIGDKKVIMAISGGVDSTVAATLIHKAIGEKLFCIFVDNGLLRKNEFEQVLNTYKNIGLNIKGVQAKDRFYTALKGVSDPELKRKAIGKSFIEVFDEEAKQLTDISFLGQGTIYPDVIESLSVHGPSATIKSHHNVGGLPHSMKLNLVEPLRLLFKDEVRRVGLELGISENLIQRHPFPGPGLGIRILGEIDAEKVRLLQDADNIFINGLKNANLYKEVWQAGAMLLPVKSVGVMGDERTYEYTLALRAVTSVDGMTADWAHLPYDFLANMSNEIINNVKGINRVVYDISSKPPATIEWE
jgi:GMP synthase (glutamine-hydrolysing)